MVGKKKSVKQFKDSFRHTSFDLSGTVQQILHDHRNAIIDNIFLNI